MAAISGLAALTLVIAKDARAVDWHTVTAPAATDRLEAQAPVPSSGAGATRDTIPEPAEYREPSFDYGLTGYAGKSATNGFTSLFYAPWNTEFEETHLDWKRTRLNSSQ